MNELQKAETQLQQGGHDPIMKMLETVISNPDADITKLERVIDLFDRMQRKQAEMAFYDDFAKFQGEIPVIPKDGEIIVNGVVRSKYSKYETIMKHIQPILTTYGLSVMFDPKFVNGTVEVTCQIGHKSGFTKTTLITLPYDTSGGKNNVQAVASALSYGKRYALCLILNIPTGGEDDDGNGVPPVEKKKAMNTKQFDKAIERIKTGEIENIDVIEQHFTLNENQRKKLQEVLQGKQ
jgi:hypothetical protein